MDCVSFATISSPKLGWRSCAPTPRSATLGRSITSLTVTTVRDAPGGRLVIDDPGLQIHTADELRAEIEAGIRVDASDLNPARLFRERK